MSESGSNAGESRLNQVSRRDALKGVSAGAMMTSFTGCLSSPGAGGSETFKIGGLWALSQGWGTWGKMQKQHVKYAIEQINNDGGIDGRDVELILEDTELDPQATTEKARKLVQRENVDILVGPNASSSRVAMSEVAEQEEVPHLYPVYYEGVEAPDYCRQWLFKFSGVPYGTVKPIVPWALDKWGPKVYLIGDDYVWPHATNAQIRKFVNEEGGEIVDETYVEFNTTDFSSILPKIEEIDPDIVWSTTVIGSVPFLQQSHNRGLRDNWGEIFANITNLGVRDKEPEPLNGVFEPHVYWPAQENKENKEMISGLQEKYGDDLILDTIGGVYYTCVSALPQVVENGGGTSNEQLKKGYEQLSDFSSPLGPLTMKRDHQAELTYKLAEIQINEDEPYWKAHKVRQEFGPLIPEDVCDEI